MYLLLLVSIAYFFVSNNGRPARLPFTPDAQKKDVVLQKSPKSPYIITTVVGTGEAGFSGDGGSARNARINTPYGIVASEDGALYISDRQNERIRKVDPTGIITTFAGVGPSQSICTNEPIESAHIPLPEKLSIGGDGSLYISSSSDNRVRKIDSLGVVKVVAGTGDRGYNMDKIVATSSQLNSPGGTASDLAGNLYIADTLNNRIRKVGPNGIITTIAGTGTAGFSGDNGLAIKAKIDSPTSVAVSSDGSIYFIHGVSPRIRKISPSGNITTVAGTGIAGFSQDGELAKASQLSEWSSITIAEDKIYIVDHNNHRILYIDEKGRIKNIAGTGAQGYEGDDGNSNESLLGHPTGVAIVGEDAIYVSDADNNRIRKLTPLSSR